MHHVTKPSSVLGFHSLNTIDKDCVTVASRRGRKMSGQRSSESPNGKASPERDGETVPGAREKCRNGVTWILPAHDCCQSVPVLLVSLFLVMNVGVTTCI